MTRTLLRQGSGLDHVKSGLLNYHVGRLQSLRALFHIECYLLTFGQSLEAVAGNSTEMHKYIVSAIILRDEAETLGFIEPLYCACSHYFYLKLIN